MEWTTNTPDGRRLIIRREPTAWVVMCGEASEARSGLLDVALIEAIRADRDALARSLAVDLAEWTRRQADRIERDVQDVT